MARGAAVFKVAVPSFTFSLKQTTFCLLCAAVIFSEHIGGQGASTGSVVVHGVDNFSGVPWWCV